MELKEKELQVNLEWLIEFEGLVLEIYPDSLGIPTVGIGRNLEVFPFNDEEKQKYYENGERWTESEAKAWALEEVKSCRKSVVVGCPWVVNSPSLVRMVLTDMAYNLGLTGLWGFRKMLKAMKAGDFLEAAEQLKDSRYYRQTGRRAKHHYNALKELGGK